MPKFQARIRDVKYNTIKTITIVASSEQEAAIQLKSEGNLISIQKKLDIFDIDVGMTPAERQIFFSRLSALLMSRMGTSAALILIRDTFSGRIRHVSELLVRHIEKGKTLGDAFQLVGSSDFPESTIALIKAGSQTGESYKAIKTAAAFEKELTAIKKNANGGLWVAIFGFIFAAVTTAVSALYVGPLIVNSPLIKSAKGVDISMIDAFAKVTGYFMIGIMAFLILFWLISTIGRRISPVSVDKFILRIPFYKDLVLARSNFIVLYGLQLLIRSGVKIEEALRLTGESSNPGALRQDLLNAAKAVKIGKAWPTYLSTFHPTDKAALSSAVDRTQVADSLFALSEQYREMYAQRMEVFIPALKLIAAIFLMLGGAILFGEAILPMLMAASGGF